MLDVDAAVALSSPPILLLPGRESDERRMKNIGRGGDMLRILTLSKFIQDEKVVPAIQINHSHPHQAISGLFSDNDKGIISYFMGKMQLCIFLRKLHGLTSG